MYCGGTNADGDAIQCGCHAGEHAELPIVAPVHPPEAVVLPSNGVKVEQAGTPGTPPHVAVTEVVAAPAGAVKADVVPDADDPSLPRWEDDGGQA